MGIIESIRSLPNYGNVNISGRDLTKVYKDNVLIWQKAQVKAIGYFHYYDNGPDTSSSHVVNYENGLDQYIHYTELINYGGRNAGYIRIEYPNHDNWYRLTSLIDNLYYQRYPTNDLSQLIHLKRGQQIIFGWAESLRTYYFYKYE